MAKRILTSRQPAADAADVIYNGSDFDAFSNGRYLSSHTSSQDAWIVARKAHFEQVEAEAALPPQVICDTCGQIKDDLGRCGCDYEGVTEAYGNAELDELIRRLLADIPAITPRVWDVEPGLRLASYEQGLFAVTMEEGDTTDDVALIINRSMLQVSRAHLRALSLFLTQVPL